MQANAPRMGMLTAVSAFGFAQLLLVQPRQMLHLVCPGHLSAVDLHIRGLAVWLMGRLTASPRMKYAVGW